MIEHVVERTECMCPGIISEKEIAELFRYIKIHYADTKNCKRLLHDFSTNLHFKMMAFYSSGDYNYG
jgi:hypothetical protein